MANSESSSQLPPPNNGRSYSDRDKNNSEEEGEKERSSFTSTTQKVALCAAVAGTDLLALRSLSAESSERSNDTNDQRMVALEGKGFGYQVPRLPDDDTDDNTDEDTDDDTDDNTDDQRMIVLQSREVKGPDPCRLRDTNRFIKIMSYNVGGAKDLKINERMSAISRLIQQKSPDIILLQEVTPSIYTIFQDCDWWMIYKCSVPQEKATRKNFCLMLCKLPVKRFNCSSFDNCTMGRGLCCAVIDAGGNKELIAATSHLKRPILHDMNSDERVAQAKEALSWLNPAPNVVFGGDMDWDENADGDFPLFGEWYDAWSVIRPREYGWTFDTESNGMLKYHWPLQKRLDRFICKLRDFKTIDVVMIGKDPIPGISYYQNGEKLPVLPSDHYGLILTIRPK